VSPSLATPPSIETAWRKPMRVWWAWMPYAMVDDELTILWFYWITIQGQLILPFLNINELYSYLFIVSIVEIKNSFFHSFHIFRPFIFTALQINIFYNCFPTLRYNNYIYLHILQIHFDLFIYWSTIFAVSCSRVHCTSCWVPSMPVLFFPI